MASISIHAPRVGSDYRNGAGDPRREKISIHAPRVGSDIEPFPIPLHWTRISIHAPRVGSDNPHDAGVLNHFQFQSTLPAWGATWTYIVIARTAQFQSTLPAWGATAVKHNVANSRLHFNPRSPRGERRRRFEPV